MRAKEFLGAQNVGFESLNVLERTGRKQWEQLGRPPVPALVVDGVAVAIMHTSQICGILGLPVANTGNTARTTWDIYSLLDGWSTTVRGLEWETVVKATPSRGRSLRNLTVNVSRPVALIPLAWNTGVFEWNPDLDDRLELDLQSPDDVADFVRAASLELSAFLLDEEDNLNAHDPDVRSPRGDLRFSALVEYLRMHTAYHYRQLDAFLRSESIPTTAALSLERMDGLALPADVF